MQGSVKRMRYLCEQNQALGRRRDMTMAVKRKIDNVESSSACVDLKSRRQDEANVYNGEITNSYYVPTRNKAVSHVILLGIAQ